MDTHVDANIILRGGPSSLTQDERELHVNDTREKIKMLLGNRYEHFEPTQETERRSGRDLVIYAWTGRTYVAE